METFLELFPRLLKAFQKPFHFEKNLHSQPPLFSQRPMKAPELVDQYQKGNRDFRNVNLTKITWQTPFSQTAIIKADLRGANFSGSDLYWIVFSQSNLTKAILVNTLIIQGEFSEACLQEADLSNSRLFGSNFSYSFCRKANFTKTDLRTSNLSGANFFEANLEKAYLGAALIDKTIFYKTNLNNVGFKQIILKEVTLHPYSQNLETINQLEIWTD